MTEVTFESKDFEPITHAREVQSISRPSLSYWQDAWIRLKANTRALISLYIVIGLTAFTILGPVVWNIEPEYGVVVASWHKIQAILKRNFLT